MERVEERKVVLMIVSVLSFYLAGEGVASASVCKISLVSPL